MKIQIKDNSVEQVLVTVLWPVAGCGQIPDTSLLHTDPHSVTDDPGQPLAPIHNPITL